MHSVANLATLQTPLATFFPSKKRPNLVSENRRTVAPAQGLALPARTHLSLSLSLCLSVQRAHSLSLSAVCSARSLSRLLSRERSSALIQLNTDIMLLSNFTCKYSRNHSTAIVFILCAFDFIRRWCDYHDFFVCRLTSWKGAGYVVLMGHVSVTISYSFRCLTTETVKYTSFIENLASSKYSMWAKIGKQM